MNLQFTNKGGNFVSEFEVTSDFNLHIEGVRLSDMHIYQKTAGGSYAKVTDFPSERSQDRVADFDFASLVYPKFIKVVCATEPTYAEIATDGEVTEIKSQSKEVEIVSNGVTEIAPDAGFGYLSGVKVNVNVPQSGGGTEGGMKVEYIKYDENAGIMLNTFLLAMALSLRIKYADGTIAFGPKGFLDLMSTEQSDVEAVMVSWDDVKGYGMGSVNSLREFLIGNGMSEEELGALPRLTEEEFYSL